MTVHSIDSEALAVLGDVVYIVRGNVGGKKWHRDRGCGGLVKADPSPIPRIAAVGYYQECLRCKA